MQSTLVDDGVVQPPPEGSFKPSSLLLQHSDGIYTAALFERRRGLVDWDLHMQRFARSTHHLGAHQLGPSQAPRSPPLTVSAAICRNTYIALADFCESNTGRDWERAMVTILLRKRDVAAADADSALRVLVLVYPLLSPSLGQPVVVGVHGRPRQNPSIKQSNWARERQPIEQRKSSEMAEVLLSTDEGEVTEGLVSNFFVVTRSGDGGADVAVQTAPYEMVLRGVLRARVLEACVTLGVPVTLKPPDLRLCGEWTEAFLTNCVRGIQPVCCVVTDGCASAPRVELPSPHGEITQRLQAVLAQLQSYTPFDKLEY